MEKNLKFIKKIDGFDYYEYTPKVTKLFYKHNENMTLLKKIRFMLDYIRGFKVYYMFSEQNMVGYCMVARGGSYRLEFTSKEDVVLGPAYIAEEKRGQGLNSVLCENILNKFNLNYRYAYSYIRKNNLSSIKSFEKVGFALLYSAKISRFTRAIKLTSNNEGMFFIYRYEKKR